MAPISFSIRSMLDELASVCNRSPSPGRERKLSSPPPMDEGVVKRLEMELEVAVGGGGG